MLTYRILPCLLAHWSVWHFKCGTSCKLNRAHVPAKMALVAVGSEATMPHPLAFSTACAFHVGYCASIANCRVWPVNETLDALFDHIWINRT